MPLIDPFAEPLSLRATPGKRDVLGTVDADTLVSTSADEAFGGRGGADTFVFNRGFGQDQIGILRTIWHDDHYDTDLLETYDADDVIRFGDGIGSDEVGVALTRRPSGLGDGQIWTNVTFTLGESKLTVLNWDRADGMTVRFDDGTTWTFDGPVLRLAGAGAAPDTLLGTTADDVIESAATSDVLQGDEGTDTYRFSGQFGDDLVRDAAYFVNDGTFRLPETSVLEFAGLDADDVTYGAAGGALVIRSGTNSVTVEHFFDAFYRNKTFTVARFDDGDVRLENNPSILVVREGTAGADSLSGLTGGYVETFEGGAGDDTFDRSSVGDTIRGGVGDDRLSGAGELHGGVGDDVLGTTIGVAYGDAGADVITVTNGSGRAFGGTGDDRISAAAFATLRGDAGNDTITGGGDVDGGTGDDFIDGGYRGGRIAGGDGDDRVSGSGTLLGGVGDDTLTGRGTMDSLYGAAGRDVAVGGLGDDLVDGGADRDVLGGGAGDDRVFGQLGDDTLRGDANDDTLFGGAGNDSLDGGTGNDVARGDVGNDRIGGSYGRDRLEGGEGNDTLGGGFGDDTVAGGLGNDRIDGGEGDDLLFGGAGADVFVFVGTSGKDTVGGFASGSDRLDLSWFQSLQPGETLTLDDLRLAKAGDDVAITLDLDGDGRTDRIDIDRDGRLDAVRILLTDTRLAELDRGDFIL